MKNYFNISLILSLFIVLLTTNSCEEEEVMGYNCVNNSCISSENAQFISIEDCLLACSNNGGGNSNNITTWNCMNYNCVESTQSSGLYTSLADCESACSSNSGSGSGSGSGSISSYNCNNGNCLDPGDGSGAYTNLSSCLSNCGNVSDCDDNYTINSSISFELGEGPSEIINFGDIWGNGTTNFEIRLFTSSVSGDADGPSYEGTGNLVLLELHSNGTPEGTYSFYPYDFIPFSAPVNSCTPKYFINQNMYNYSMDMAFPSDAISLSYLTITEDGDDEYTIDFEFNTSNGVFNGCYSGELDYWNASGGSGSGSGSGLTDGSEAYRKTKNPNIY